MFIGIVIILAFQYSTCKNYIRQIVVESLGVAVTVNTNFNSNQLGPVIMNMWTQKFLTKYEYILYNAVYKREGKEKRELLLVLQSNILTFTTDSMTKLEM